MLRQLAFTSFAALLKTLLPSAMIFALSLEGRAQAPQHRQRVAVTAPAGVPASRLTRLRRGINLSHWFAQSQDYSVTHLQTHITARDIALIKGLGFDHVRLAVEPAPLLDESDPARLKTEHLRHLDAALDMLLGSGLRVVFDIHPSDDFKIKLGADEKHVAAFVDFWRSLARHLSRRDPGRIFLEILNEPVLEDADRWMGIQLRLAAAIREGAPRHTIIATGPRWSAIDQLLLIEPLADRNMIYNFHFYEHHTFTHQGATWGAEYWPYLKNVPYPSSPEIVSGRLPSIENQPAREALRDYGEQRWNAALVERHIARAAGWGRKYGVPLVCNEFGVYRAYAPVAARLRWIEDVRTALERHGIGWAMWDYAGGFAVAPKKDGRAMPDAQTVAALGLQRSVRRSTDR